MKPLFKVALIKTLLFLMTSSAAATTLHTQAFSYFNDPAGNTGFVFVDRVIDPTTKVMTTTLYYSFCVQTTAASCQEGHGVIPNKAFSGQFTSGLTAEVMKLVADTTVSGFVNLLCNAPNELGCTQGESPATGGPILLTYTKKARFDEDFIFIDRKIENNKYTLYTTDKTSQGPAYVRGTVLGVAANNDGASWGVESLTGFGTPQTKAQKAVSHLTLDQSLAPNALRRLQQMKAQRPTAR